MLKKLNFGLKNSRGDTIVEVMVVLAVLGMAISISYATANRSLLDARQAQENVQATELAQSQLEALRTLTSATVSPTIFQAGPYCTYYDTTLPTPAYTVVTFPSIPPPPPQCVNGLYTIQVTYASSTNTFTVIVSWPDIEGQGNDTVTLVYRLYQTP